LRFISLDQAARGVDRLTRDLLPVMVVMGGRAGSPDLLNYYVGITADHVGMGVPLELGQTEGLRTPKTLIFAALLLVVAMIGPARADKRVALVIGNSAYQHAPTLANPKNDAIDMAATLKQLKFTVIDGLDLDRPAMERKLREFARALAASDAGLLFYAGHGLQVDGQNYLVPVDAKLDDAAALDFELVRLDLVQRTMERETRTNLLFLDACRDNPLARNLARALGTRSASIGRGLANVEAGGGTLISFSTQPGNVAFDGNGRNSPFAGAVLKYMAEPNVDVAAMLIKVRQNRQVPWEHSALTEAFYFNQSTQAGPASPGKQGMQLSEAAEAWSMTRETTNVALLEAFAARFKDTFYADLAHARIAELKQQQIAASTPLSTAAPNESATSQVHAFARPKDLASPAALTEKSPPTYKVRFDTSKGPFVVEVHRDWAPNGADRFYNLVRNGFYDETRFFRVISGFMVQFGINGDPAISGPWRSATIKDDPAKQSNKRGTITFASAGPDSRTSQVFINFADNSQLDHHGYSPFGQVTSGMGVVDALYSGYGEGAPSGRGPEQGRIQREGNAYLKKDFPNLDYVNKATIEK